MCHGYRPPAKFINVLPFDSNRPLQESLLALACTAFDDGAEIKEMALDMWEDYRTLRAGGVTGSVFDINSRTGVISMNGPAGPISIYPVNYLKPGLAGLYGEM